MNDKARGPRLPLAAFSPLRILAGLAGLTPLLYHHLRKVRKIECVLVDLVPFIVTVDAAVHYRGGLTLATVHQELIFVRTKYAWYGRDESV